MQVRFEDKWLEENIYGGDLISYGRLEDCVARTAAMLRHKGITPGSDVKRLCISIPNLEANRYRR